MVRLPGCNNNPETTVLAHWRDASTGMSKKSNDLIAAWCCSDCHDSIDGRSWMDGYSPMDLKFAHLEAILRTIQALSDEGVI